MWRRLWILCVRGVVCFLFSDEKGWFFFGVLRKKVYVCTAFAGRLFFVKGRCVHLCDGEIKPGCELT